MNPILHVSIYYRGCSKFRTELRKHLSSYTKRLLSNPWEPTVDICLDTFNTQEAKRVQQELYILRLLLIARNRSIRLQRNYILLLFCSSALQCNGYTKIIQIQIQKTGL